MIGFIVSGHGGFATGMMAALKLIMGEQQNCIAVDFPENDAKTEIETNMRNAIHSLSHCKEIIIFCDLLSGTPFNTAITEALNADHIQVVYGTNLGMLMESILAKDNEFATAKIIAANAVNSGKNSIGIFDVKFAADDDDF